MSCTSETWLVAGTSRDESLATLGRIAISIFTRTSNFFLLWHEGQADSLAYELPTLPVAYLA